jgi:nucleoside-diphosphate-sugar epimerase
MKILVTGHHGYIGSITVPALVRAGHDVVGLDTFLYEGCDLFAEEWPQARRADVRDLGSRDLEGFDGVVHLAALSNDPLGALSPELTLEINCDAAVTLARAAREAGVQRFVFASSCSMYGAAGTDDAISEEAPLKPLTAYAESKVRAEEALHALADDSFSPVFMRNATAFGASPRLRLDIVLNNLVGWALTTGAVRILSDGTPWRPLVHVQDIARATVAMLEAPREVVHAQAYNVGSDRDNYRVSELAEIVQAVVGDCAIEYAGTGDPDPRSYRVDFGKLSSRFPDLRLDWDAERGAQELVTAYRAAGMTRELFDGPTFVRLRRLEEQLASGMLDRELRWQQPAVTTG